MNEIWKDIEGYEELYQVSNMGKVRSVDRIDGAGHLKRGRILSFRIHKAGYYQVHLHKEGERKTFSVHRLVAQAFIPNPDNLPQINHKDEDKSNNRVDNLEWCTARYNMNYGTRNERMIQTKISKGLVDPELCGIGDRNDRKRLSYYKNREDILENKRLLYQENRDQILEYQREWREKNRDQINERDRERYHKNRDQISERRRERYQKNRDQINERRREQYHRRRKKSA